MSERGTGKRQYRDGILEAKVQAARREGTLPVTEGGVVAEGGIDYDELGGSVAAAMMRAQRGGR